MQYPNISKYKDAVIEQECFNKLQDDIEPVWTGNDLKFVSGNFAVVFEMEQNGKKHALKCFTRDIQNRSARQKEIVEYVKNNPSPYFVDYHFLENELWVDGADYPVTWMEWVEAPTLGEKIKELCDNGDRQALKELAETFRRFALWILDMPFAHGDLKHDNILIKDNGELVLVDYDGMFVPALAGEKATETGGKSYQHPGRSSNDFNRHLDDFSILIIYTSLLTLAKEPELYHKFNNGQNIIFSHPDFLSFENSAVFERLAGIRRNNSEIDDLLNAIQGSLNSGGIAIKDIKQLLGENIIPLRNNPSLRISPYKKQVKLYSAYVGGVKENILEIMHVDDKVELMPDSRSNGIRTT